MRSNWPQMHGLRLRSLVCKSVCAWEESPYLWHEYAGPSGPKCPSLWISHPGDLTYLKWSWSLLLCHLSFSYLLNIFGCPKWAHALTMTIFSQRTACFCISYLILTVFKCFTRRNLRAAETAWQFRALAVLTEHLDSASRPDMVPHGHLELQFPSWQQQTRAGRTFTSIK